MGLHFKYPFVLTALIYVYIRNKSRITLACYTIHIPLLLLSLVIYLSYWPTIFQFLTRLPLLGSEGPKHSIYATGLVKCSRHKFLHVKLIFFTNFKSDILWIDKILFPLLSRESLYGITRNTASPQVCHSYTPLLTLGDGNCLFRAISFEIHGTEKYHMHLQLRNVLEMYKPTILPSAAVGIIWEIQNRTRHAAYFRRAFFTSD